MKTFVPVLIAALALTMTFSTLSVAADTGADLFKAKCAMCHGLDGKGDTAMGKNLKVHDLGSADVQKQTDAELNGIITNGKGKMPKYDGKLTKEQITELVKFVRSLKK
jgi:mono/diheme cytochrome c family protein